MRGSEEGVVVEGEAPGGVGGEQQLVPRRPELGPEPHPPERLEDLVPVGVARHHHLLDAPLHLHPLHPCIYDHIHYIFIQSTVRIKGRYSFMALSSLLVLGELKERSYRSDPYGWMG